MRLDPTLTVTAADLVNRLDEKELADLIYLNSGERRSRRIAAKIIAQRRQSPIKTTMALAEVIPACVRVSKQIETGPSWLKTTPD